MNNSTDEKNTDIQPIDLDIDEDTNNSTLYKRKRSIPAKLKENENLEISSQNSTKIAKLENITDPIISNKRPRGRPPLAHKNLIAKIKPDPLKRSYRVIPQSIVTPKSQAIVKKEERIKRKYTLSGKTDGRGRKPGVSITYSSKSKSQVMTNLTQKIIGKLITSEPLTSSDLVKLIPESNIEEIQSIVEVLVVLGVVVSLKLPSDDKADPYSAPNFYTLVGFLRSPEPLNISEFDKIISAKESNTQAIRKRIQDLKEISSSVMTKQDRIHSLRAFMEDQMANNRSLNQDALYQSFVNILSHVKHR